MRAGQLGLYQVTSYPYTPIPLKGLGGGGDKVNLYVPAHVPKADTEINVVESREDDKVANEEYLQGKAPVVKPFAVDKPDPPKKVDQPKRPLPLTNEELTRLENNRVRIALPLPDNPLLKKSTKERSKVSRQGFFKVV